MEGFHYIDIFATKHIEYLLVIGFLLLFVPFWRFLNRPARMIYETGERVIASMGDWFRLPEGFYYHLGHSWAIPESPQVVKVGIDDFAQKLVGKISAIQMPEIGSTIHQGDKGWALKVDSKSIDMVSPVDGKVIAINEEVLHSPETINQDPYQNWLMKVEAPRFSINRRHLLQGDLAKKWIEALKENLLSRTNYHLGLVYQDGGKIVDGMAKNLDQEKWEDIVKDFFLTT